MDVRPWQSAWLVARPWSPECSLASVLVSLGASSSEQLDLCEELGLNRGRSVAQSHN